jgi:hypothetical protein
VSGPNCAADVAEFAGGAASTGVGAVAGRVLRPLLALGAGILGVTFDLAAFADSPCAGGE